MNAVSLFLRGIAPRPNAAGPLLRGRLHIVGAHRYPPAGPGATAEERLVRAVAYDLKVADPAAVRVAAAAMAPTALALAALSPVLVPVPDSRGSTAANLALAEAVGRLADLRVVDALARAPSESQYERRKAGLAALTADAMDVRWVGPRPTGLIVLVDNVVASGATVEAARLAVGDVDALALAWADAGWLAWR